MKNPVNKSIHQFLIKKCNKTLSVDRPVSVITCTNKEGSINNILDNFNRQNVDLKELLIIINNNKIDEYKWRNKILEYQNIRIFKIDESTSLGRCLNFGVHKAKHDIIAKFDDDDYYGPKYLSDSIRHFDYTNASLIGKATIFVYFIENKTLAVKDPGLENRYVNFINGSSFIFKKDLFNFVQFRDVSISEDLLFCIDCIDRGLKIYSGNPYHLVYIRHSTLDKHTWQISNNDLMKLYCHNLGQVDDFIPYVDI